MTAPDPKILAEGIAEAEKGLAIFRPYIDDPDIKREVELSEAFVAAAKAYRPWALIDTAPKSTTTPTPHGHDVKGIYLLGFCPEEGATPESCICIIWWEPHHHGDHKGAWVSDAGFEVEPTHWQYPPAPPAALNRAGPA